LVLEENAMMMKLQVRTAIGAVVGGVAGNIKGSKQQ
jgi:hypothetical protein